MCGIFGIYNFSGQPNDVRYKALALSKKLRHRGPDWSGCFMTGSSVLVHERLAIVGLDTGEQPLLTEDRKTALCVNGEIYNHKALAKKLQIPLKVKPKSDCEIILHLYREYGTDLCNMLDGMFSFILLDDTQTPPRLIVARDPIGITTLYYGTSSSHPETMYIASELKSIHEDCDNVHAFPPGHFYDSSLPADSRFTRYYNPDWLHADADAGLLSRTKPVDLTLIRSTLEAAVRKRLMSEVPFGVLLSGGLDSSLIAAIATREIQRINEAYAVQIGKGSSPVVPKNQAISSGLNSDGSLASSLPGVEEEVTVDSESSLASWPRLHSFSIGLKDAPDLIAARQAAEFLHTLHHEFTFTVQEGLDAIPDVIYHLETYDVTTVRASTPMYLLSRKIKATGVKMVLSGEGSDEIFGGYLYFSQAPDKLSFYQETIKRVKNLHTSDCLRANKSTMAWGLEARVPFLDKEFLSLCLNIRPEDKMFGKGAQQSVDSDGKPIMEKYILRKAFDCSPDGKPYLPETILWRQKEQFSDGVGYSWIDGLKEHAEKLITDEQLSSAHSRWTLDTPTTKEAYLIRQIFEKHFPSESAAKTSVRWIPRTDWGCDTDPSGRSVKIHTSAY
ncbi:asparagine synthetase [Puccinia graminis f. sp. tritici]|uniref:asparagine synthase (glutamine-hydrolyzing) n=4 Tax=Puccinia graminis f. sp. tritici TaxID=56615 RepID=E3JZB6_PUCGT|nr:asparagine synthase (glutamine-hydrolyzing) [Puccinia graminis f. sp. tritici CRL 75-36-700-3]EFP77391.2 asparagine synthase (glutamine-hydrolysing) [Puccinia graminis f. sp. tritici CRL 75-36-700-3]KAA1088338.1 asparagine synthetase [Puccinia graminis f. sp. tritici]